MEERLVEEMNLCANCVGTVERRGDEVKVTLEDLEEGSTKLVLLSRVIGHSSRETLRQA